MIIEWSYVHALILVMCVTTQKVVSSRTIIKAKLREKNKRVGVYLQVCLFGGMGAITTWRIVLLKVAYYATISAQNFAKSCQRFAIIPNLCSC